MIAYPMLPDFLFVAVLAQAFFALVRRHFMAFPLFSAGHARSSIKG
jgi:hypothetical protein